MRRADEQPNSLEPAGVALTRGIHRRRALALALFIACLAGFVSLSALNKRASASSLIETSRATATSTNAPQTNGGSDDFSKFSHRSQRHATLACASCHRREANNSTRPNLPGHKACTDCHLAQFVTVNIPMCAICHADVQSQNPPVKAFPSIASFNVKFDHAQHNAGAARPAAACAACHAPASRRSAAMTIPAGFNAHAQCYACHQPGAQANGRDIASCGVCHSIAARYFRTSTASTAFRASFSHAAHGARQRLGCADCHNLRPGLPQSRQVTATAVSQHFNLTRAQSCMTCHNGKRAFGDADFNDCRRCHQGTTFRMGG